jgi:DnaJ-class molecular chaperone
MMEFRDYYATLGVQKTATDKEVKQAYRKLARKFHPDVNPGDKKAENRFKEINEAYEVLGDTEKRKKYDELGANWKAYEQAQRGQGPGASGPDVRTWTWNMGGGPDQTMSAEEFEAAFGGSESPFSDFFRTFFGGEPARARGGRASSRRRPGHDLELDITLTLEEAYQGTQRQVAIKSAGHTEAVPVRIPAGVKDGARLRVPGKGEPGTGGAAPGNLFLQISLQPHERFERRGNDLHVRLVVPLTTAVLGGEAEVPTLSGKAVRLRVPETTQNGQVFRLRGHGMPSVGKPQEHGDLYAAVDVQLPRRLTEEARRHYEALAALASDETSR